MSRLALLLAGCTTPLTSDRIVGADLDAAVWDGAEGDLLGTLVATDGERVLAYAAGSRTLTLLTAEGELIWSQESAESLDDIWLDNHAYAWSSGVGLFRVDDMGPYPVEMEEGRVCLLTSGWSSVRGASALACEDSRQLWTVCSRGRCSVFLDGEQIGVGGPEVTVGFLGGQPCWSSVAMDMDPQPGEVHCADGSVLFGLEGDHLGASIGGGRAAGVFNKWLVPPRLRLLSPDRESWALERARERTRASVASAGRLTVIGLPGYSGENPGEGRLYIVED